MSEVSKTSLLIDPKIPIDSAHWVPFYELLGQIKPIYEELLPSKSAIEQAKAGFFASGMSIDPDLTPGEVDYHSVTDQELQVEAIKRQVIDSKLEPYAKNAWRWRVNEEVANLRMLRASVRGEMAEFAHYDHFIYGKPSPRIFAGTVDWFRHQADSALTDGSSEVREAARAVMEILPDMGGSFSVLMPDPAIFGAIKDQHWNENGYFPRVMERSQLPEGQKITQDIGDLVLRQVLSNVGAGHYELADAKGSVWSVDNRRARYNRPTGYDMLRSRFLGLGVGHEPSHALEFQNGLRQELQLFAAGLDRNEAGNEGRAVMREQVVYANFEQFTNQLRWQDILRRHFAISLAEGLLDSQKKSFHEIFAVVNAVDRLWERSKDPDDIVTADEKANKRTWDLLATRIFRGTDGKGAVYSKDMLYLEGNIAVWEIAKQQPELISQGDLGKFDITNPRHIAIAQAAGVIPTGRR